MVITRSDISITYLKNMAHKALFIGDSPLAGERPWLVLDPADHVGYIQKAVLRDLGDVGNYIKAYGWKTKMIPCERQLSGDQQQRILD